MKHPVEHAMVALGLAGVMACGVFGPQSVVPTVELAVCIVTRAAFDTEHGMSGAAIAGDVASYCETDAATVVATLGEVRKAKARLAADGGRP